MASGESSVERLELDVLAAEFVPDEADKLVVLGEVQDERMIEMAKTTGDIAMPALFKDSNATNVEASFLIFISCV